MICNRCGRDEDYPGAHDTTAGCPPAWSTNGRSLDTGEIHRAPLESQIAALEDRLAAAEKVIEAGAEVIDYELLSCVCSEDYECGACKLRGKYYLARREWEGMK